MTLVRVTPTPVTGATLALAALVLGGASACAQTLNAR